MKSLEEGLREQVRGDFTSVLNAGAILPPFSEEEMTACNQALRVLINRRHIHDETIVHLPSAVMPLLL